MSIAQHRADCVDLSQTRIGFIWTSLTESLKEMSNLELVSVTWALEQGKYRRLLSWTKVRKFLIFKL